MFALGSFSTTNPMTDIVYLPFVVPSQDRMFQVLHGDLGRFVDGIAGKANLRVMAYFAGSGGQFGSKGRALRKPEISKVSRSGCRARSRRKSSGASAACPPRSMHRRSISPLQRGTVDGTNFPLTSFYDRKLYETVDRLTFANVSFDPDTVVISRKPGPACRPPAARP